MQRPFPLPSVVILRFDQARRWLAADPALSYSLKLFLGFRVLLSGFGILLWRLHLVPTTGDPVVRPYFGLEPVVAGMGGYLLGIWQRFDAIHYLRIAAGGYITPDLSAFPPLYPLLVRLAAVFSGGDILMGSLLVSNVACLLLLIGLYRLGIEENLGKHTVRRSILYLLCFPTAFFLLVPYTESVFLLFSMVTLREARRGRWLWAGIAATGAALTRLQGVCLAAVITYEVLQQAGWQVHRSGWRLGAALLPVLGFGGFVLWRQWMGYPSIPALQAEYWQRVPALPWAPILMTGRRVITGTAIPVEIVDMTVVLLMLAVGIQVLRSLPLRYGLYFWSILLFSLSQVRIDQPLSSMARFCLVLFPAFIVLGQLGRSPVVHRLILYTSTVLWLLLAGQFILWGWVG